MADKLFKLGWVKMSLQLFTFKFDIKGLLNKSLIKVRYWKEMRGNVDYENYS